MTRLAGNKYHARRTVIDGVSFASRREAHRYRELQLLERAGVIAGLRLQPEYPLLVDGIPVGVYRADFAYTENGRHVVEDAKGYRTALYRWKKKHVEAQYRIVVRET